MDESTKVFRMVEMTVVKVVCSECDEEIGHFAIDVEETTDVGIVDHELPELYCKDCYDNLKEKLKEADVEVGKITDIIGGLDLNVS